MSKVQMLRVLVNQRLTAAAEEIFVLFERTIAEYEEELCRSKEEKERQRKLLDAVFNPQLQLHRADVQQLLKNEEEVPPEQQQERSSSLDQQDPEPPHIKEEQEELLTSQEGEQLLGLVGVDIPSSPVSVKKSEDDEEPSQLHQSQTEEDRDFVGESERSSNVYPDSYLQLWTNQEGDVKSEDDEEKPQSSQLHQRQTEQMETEADGEDCGGPEPDRDSDPDRHLQPDDNNNVSDSSETDISDDALKNKEVPFRDKKYNTGEISVICPVCGKTFCSKSYLKKHKKIHTGERPYSCSVCGKGFIQRGQFTSHMTVHTGEKPFSCSVCQESFRLRKSVVKHMKVHTEEEPVSGSVSGKKLNTYDNINRESEPAGNMTLSEHNDAEVSDDGCRETRERKGEKPFSCTVCQRQFARKKTAEVHMRLHSGERPFGCSVCGKRFNQKVCLQLHTRSHTGEKPYSCTLCDKRFIHKRSLIDHMPVHMREKRYMCTACDERFTWLYQLKNHQAVCDPVKFHEDQTAKKFCCSECGKMFCHRYRMKQHMELHVQERNSTSKNS